MGDIVEFLKLKETAANLVAYVQRTLEEPSPVTRTKGKLFRQCREREAEPQTFHF